MNLIDSKSILAKLMATEDLIVEQRNVSTAFFDVQNRILTVPVLDKNISSQLYDLFMGHEVGHALYTPLEGLKKSKEEKVNMSVLNIVEDSRIERKIKYKYPGLKNSFVKAYQELLERNFFETAGKDLNEYNFIDRVNLHCKGGALLTIKFNETERELLGLVESTETFDEVVEVTKKIIDYMKLEEEERKKQKEERGEDDSDEDYDTEEYELEEGDPPNDEEDGEPKDQSEDDSEETEKSANSSSSNKDDKKSDKDEEEKIRSRTDDAYRKNEYQLFANDDTEIRYVNIPDFKVENNIFDYKDVYKRYEEEGYGIAKKEFDSFRRDSNKVVSYLVKEFEMRKNADQLKRASTAKTGDLNMKQVFSYQFNEDIFKKITVMPGGKSHGLIMFVDWSGSMARHLANTIKQLLNLVMFCKKVNIPFEVYSFVESTITEHSSTFKLKKNDFVINEFGLINLLSSRMSAKDFTYAGAALMYMSGLSSYRGIPRTPYWMSLSGTPLNETIVAAMEIIPYFQKKYKLQIVNTVFLTDGDGHSLSQYLLNDKPYHTGDVRYSGTRTKKISKVVIRDTKTKNQEEYQPDSFHNGQTTALIKLLKSRTKSNVIGIYIAHGKDYRQKVDHFVPITKSIERERAKKDRYCVVTNAGFDDYYLLRSESMDTDEDNELVVKENATTRGIVSAFNKYTSSRVGNRVILNRFINLII
jgi:hypothetical protein